MPVSQLVLGVHGGLIHRARLAFEGAFGVAVLLGTSVLVEDERVREEQDRERLEHHHGGEQILRHHLIVVDCARSGLRAHAVPQDAAVVDGEPEHGRRGDSTCRER